MRFLSRDPNRGHLGKFLLEPRLKISTDPILEHIITEPDVGTEMELDDECQGEEYKVAPDICKPLSNYLEDISVEELSRFLVPDKILQKYVMALDIVRGSSCHSCCFTKAYGNYAVGTGSILQHSLGEEDLKKSFQDFKKLQESNDFEESVKCLRGLNLRYFTPREVANLMCFPSEFSFPAHLTDKQCYRAIGNSLNVAVVSVLMRYLFSDGSQ